MRKRRLLLCASCVLIAATFSATPRSQTHQGELSHTEWVAQSLKEIETIKVGMTRADLLKVFAEEGGLSTRTWRQYAYRKCPYIKVAVEFEPVGEKEPSVFAENSKDKITKISKPFIEWQILD